MATLRDLRHWCTNGAAICLAPTIEKVPLQPRMQQLSTKICEAIKITQYLRDCGYKVIEAANAEEATPTATTLNGLRSRSRVTHGHFSGWWRARFNTAWAPTTRMRLRYWSPRFEIGPSFCLPPVDSCRGTIPIQAAKSRPDRKTFGSCLGPTQRRDPVSSSIGAASSQAKWSIAAVRQRRSAALSADSARLFGAARN